VKTFSVYLIEYNMAIINEHIVVDNSMKDIDRLIDNIKDLSKEKDSVKREIKNIIEKRIEENDKINP
jgi:hypothetical protein